MSLSDDCPDLSARLRARLPAWARHRAPWRWLLVLLLLVVSWFAFAPVQFDDAGLPLDKWRHLLAFATLGWVAVQGLGGNRRAMWRIALGLLAYGVLIEWVQSQIPGRHASAMDVAADALGIAIGLWLARRFSPAG